GPRDGPFFDRFRALGLTVAEVPTGRLGPRPLLATVRLIRRLGIEVVHTHGKGAGLHGRLAARWTGAAAVHTFHGIHYESYRRPRARVWAWGPTSPFWARSRGSIPSSGSPRSWALSSSSTAPASRSSWWATGPRRSASVGRSRRRGSASAWSLRAGSTIRRVS